MRIGFNLLLWSTFIEESQFGLIGTLRKAGYDGVEIPLFEGTPEHYAKLGHVLREEGMGASGVCVLPDEQHNAISPDAASRDGALAHIRWALDCLEAAGGDVLSGPFHQPLGVFSGEPPTKDELARLAAVHKPAADYAASLGIQLAIEPLNRFECYVLNTVAQATDLVKAVGKPNYGFLYDTFHANIEEKDPVGVVGPAIPYIKHVHISENDRGTPGKGHTPIAATLKALKHGGYDGWLTIEAFGRALPGLAAATRVWRDFFPSRDEVYTVGYRTIRDGWDAA